MRAFNAPKRAQMCMCACVCVCILVPSFQTLFFFFFPAFVKSTVQKSFSGDVLVLESGAGTACAITGDLNFLNVFTERSPEVGGELVTVFEIELIDTGARSAKKSGSLAELGGSFESETCVAGSDWVSSSFAFFCAICEGARLRFIQTCALFVEMKFTTFFAFNLQGHKIFFLFLG